MKTEEKDGERKVRQSRFPLSLFWIFFGVCAVMSGVHQGLIVFMETFEISGILQTHILLLYWCLIAAGLTLYTRKRIEKTYEIPLQKISGATKKVAHGDFSVYIPPINAPDKLDYLGRGETETAVLLTLLPEHAVPPLLAAAGKELELATPGKGILFTMPLSGVSGAVAQIVNR